MKRFWQTAAVSPADHGFAITLDNRPLRLPGGLSLTLATAALAEAVAAEWQNAAGGQGGEFDVGSLPLTRLAATQQERVAKARDDVVGALAAYAGSDLLCYRAAFPPELAARQTAAWDPLLAYLRQATSAALRVTVGVMPLTQPPQALEAVRSALSARADADLAALSAIVPATSSVVLGLCLADGAITAAHAISGAFLDEDFQVEKWGADAEAAERRARMAAEIESAAAYMRLSRLG